MSKTSRLDTIFFDEPPYYKEDVLINLEEMNITSSQGARELNRNFQNISKTLDNIPNTIVSSIENEAEKSRIQSTIENEKIASGISETNYRLLDVAIGIDGLNDSIWATSDNITEAIRASSVNIIDAISTTHDKLDGIDIQLQIVNLSLQNISNQLGDLIKKISKPNETEALELADQARQNIALNKKDRALGATEKALEMSNGTSITVLAYHILTLSLFDDDTSKKKIKENYDDFINLIGFKLTDSQSESEVILQEIYNTAYPVMAVMGYHLDSNVMLSTQKLYSDLSASRGITSHILEKPLVNADTLEMISCPNNFRELHWSVLLNEYILKSNKIEIYIGFILAASQSKVLIKNELMILAIKNFYEEGFLYGVIVDCLAGNRDETTKDALHMILSALPLDIIDIDHKTYWAMKLYADQHNIKVNGSLETKFAEASEYVKTDIEANYIAHFDDLQREMHDKEKDIAHQIGVIRQEHNEVLQKKMEEWEKHNRTIDDNDNESKIKNARKTINNLSGKTYGNFNSLASPVFGVVGFFVGIILFSIFTPPSPSLTSGFFAGLGLLLLGFLYLAFVLVGLPLIFSNIPEMFSNMLKKNNSDNISRLEDDISRYKKELAEKHDILPEKAWLYSPYGKKISDLNDQLETAKQLKIDRLTSKFNLLVSRYTPSRIEQLSKSDGEIKEYINRKVVGWAVSHKRPNDLRYEQNEISGSTIAHQEKKKYVEIDIAKVAEEYGAGWRGLHNGEQPTTEKLIGWIEGEAYRGDGMAQYLLGMIYNNSDEAYGIETDKKKSLFWFEKAANNGIAEAQCILGMAYWGDHEDYNIAQNMTMALEWLKKARDLGHLSGKYNYGLLRFYGAGVEENREEGIYWIKEARDDGLQAAQEFIAKEGL